MQQTLLSLQLGIIFFLFFSESLVFAQNDTTSKDTSSVVLPVGRSITRSIRDIYEYVSIKIQRNSYYLNEFIINSGTLSWINENNYKNVQRFYYSYIGDNTPVLRLVTVDLSQKEKKYYLEFLYNNRGELIFCREIQNDSQQYSYRQLEAFFDKGLCINLFLDKKLIDAEDAQYNTKLGLINEQGVFYANRFNEDMNSVIDE